jgi:hypothetical protein
MYSRGAILVLLMGLGVVALTGFGGHPAAEAQAARITLISLATRVAGLEEANVELEARVGELERVVDELASPAEETAPKATPTQPGLGPLPTAQPTGTPEPVASSTPVTGDVVIDGITVEWGPLLELFTVTDVRIETRRLRLEQGGSFDTQVLAFEARANYTFAIAILQADLLDAEGFAVTLPMLVEFDPDYNATEWQRGAATSGQIMLPEDLDKVVTIQIERMSVGGF